MSHSKVEMLHIGFVETTITQFEDFSLGN